MLTPVLKELTEGDEPNEHLTGSLLPLDLMTINVDSEEGRELAARYKVCVYTHSYGCPLNAISTGTRPSYRLGLLGWKIESFLYGRSTSPGST